MTEKPARDGPQAGRDPATKPKQFRVTGTDTTTGKKVTIVTTTDPATGSVVTGRDPATGKTVTLKVTGRDPAT
jgi:hypothetical protein